MTLSNHHYRTFACVVNVEAKEQGKRVEGLILYAKSKDHYFDKKVIYCFLDRAIKADALDRTMKFDDICQFLDNIIDE